MNSIKKFWFRFSLLSMAVFSGCTAAVFQPSQAVYYYPEATIHVTPDYYDIVVDHDNHVTLHTWRFKAKQKTKGVIIQFHGNAENMTSHFLSVAWVLNYGYDLVTFDYRGYGESTGTPYLPGVIDDSRKVLSFVYNLYRDQKVPIYVYGQSLGSVIANNTVARYKPPIDGVIMEGGIYSLNDVSANILSKRWFTWPVQGLGYVLMSHKYNFGKFDDDFPKVPTLILHSQDDPVISPKQSKKLHKAIPKSCLLIVPEKTHTAIGNLVRGKYRPDILKFLDSGKCP